MQYTAISGEHIITPLIRVVIKRRLCLFLASYHIVFFFNLLSGDVCCKTYGASFFISSFSSTFVARQAYISSTVF